MKKVLTTIALGGMIITCVALPGMAQVLLLFKPKSNSDKVKFRRTLKYLDNQKYIRIYQKDGKDVVEIKQKGKKKLLAYKFDEISVLSGRHNWDKKWRIVMFDIPEKKKRARNALCRKLKEMGFIELQKSVLVAPYECREEVDFIGEYFSVRGYINYVLVDKIENEQNFRKKFNL